MSPRRRDESQPGGDYRPELYGPDFYREWGVENAAYRRSAREVADIVYEQYRPKSVLDLGCGAALHAGRLRELGVRVTCADRFPCPPEFRAAGIDEIETADLMEPLASDRFPRTELTLCLDVAEHLPAESAPVLVQNCCRFSDLVVFSAAPPAQDGIGHINEQPRNYWFRLFNEAGFRHCRRESGYLDARGLQRRETLTLRWMITQPAVFRKGAKYPFPPIDLSAIPPE